MQAVGPPPAGYSTTTNPVPALQCHNPQAVGLPLVVTSARQLSNFTLEMS